MMPDAIPPRIVRILLFSLLLTMAVPVLGRPRPPLPPWPEFVLAHWTWDEALGQYPFGEAPAAIPDADLVESFSGYALRRAGAQAVPWLIPITSENGHTNFTTEVGTIRFWFQPDWSSASRGGSGPGGYARLLEVRDGTSATPTVQWALYVAPDGAAVYASGQGALGPVDFLTAPIAWTNGQWHFVALTYTPTNTTLWLDDQVAAEGPALGGGTSSWGEAGPVLVVGSDATGQNLAQGQFEELTTFRLPAQSLDLQRCWQDGSRAAALGPVTPEEDAAALAQREAISAMRVAQAPRSRLTGGILNLDSGTDVPCEDGSLARLTNCWASAANGTNWSFGFTIAGGRVGEVYDVLCATNLAAGVVANATWLTNGLPCGQYAFAQQPPGGAVYFLAWPGTGDADGDGLPDWWESLHGLNPRDAANAQTDPDHDGLSNREEYLLGSDPRSPPAWVIWVGAPQVGGNLP